jgi:hypothetical protein
MRRLSLVVVAVALVAPSSAVAAKPPSVPALVKKTAAATAKVKSFHFVLDVAHAPPNPGGLSIAAANGDVRVPDALQARFTGTFSGLKLKSALIFLAGRYFLQDPFSGKWQRLTANTNPIKFFNPGKGVLAIIGGARQLRVAGSEKVAGTDSWKLVGKVPVSALTYVLGSPPSPKLVPITIWVGKRDSILRKVLLSGPVNKGDGPLVARSLVLSNLDEHVNVKAPPVSG